MRKLTITVEEEVYTGLLAVIGKRRISGFLNDLAKPHVLKRELDAEYRAMAADEAREAEATEWGESVLMDADAARRG
jgi:predicted CopG family antitoxin